MPIKIPNELPAAKVLTDENIFIMTETRAITQDIRLSEDPAVKPHADKNRYRNTAFPSLGQYRPAN